MPDKRPTPASLPTGSEASKYATNADLVAYNLHAQRLGMPRRWHVTADELLYAIRVQGVVVLPPAEQEDLRDAILAALDAAVPSDTIRKPSLRARADEPQGRIARQPTAEL